MKKNERSKRFNEMIEREETMTYVIGVILCAMFCYVIALFINEDKAVKALNKCLPVLCVFIQMIVEFMFLMLILVAAGLLLRMNPILSFVLITVGCYPLFKLINYVVDFFAKHEMGKWVSVGNIIGAIVCYVDQLRFTIDKKYWGDVVWDECSYIIIGVSASFCLYALLRHIVKQSHNILST